MVLTGIRREAAWLRVLGMPEMRCLPLPVLWRMRRLLRHEKLTRLGGRVVINSFLPPFPSAAFRTLARALATLLRGEAAPVSAYIALTNACRFDCWHCSRRYRAGREMTLDEIRGCLRGIQALGVSVLGLTGGEPLLRADLEQREGRLPLPVPRAAAPVLPRPRLADGRTGGRSSGWRNGLDSAKPTGRSRFAVPIRLGSRRRKRRRYAGNRGAAGVCARD